MLILLFASAGYVGRLMLILSHITFIVASVIFSEERESSFYACISLH